jgi:LPXTG-motif cell wall-anchored protein
MLAISLLTGAIIAVAAIGAFFVLKKRKKIGV